MSHPPLLTVTRAAVEQLEIPRGTVRVDPSPTGRCGVAYAWTAVPAEARRSRVGCPGGLPARSPRLQAGSVQPPLAEREVDVDGRRVA